MLLPDDPVQAFMPYPAVAVTNAASGPLAGLTLAVKDIFDVAGYPTGCGQPHALAASGIKTQTAPIVQAFLDAGARFVGKTHTVELAFSLNGKNAHFGTPINPAAPGRVPGERRLCVRRRAQPVCVPPGNGRACADGHLCVCGGRRLRRRSDCAP